VTDEKRPPRITAMWLAHHYPDDYERCVVIGRSHVCRRCLVLYPLAFGVMLIALAVHPSTTVNAIAIVLLPLPAVIELVLEQLNVFTYQPVRQMAVTIPLAIGLGVAFSLYFDDQTSPLFWGPIVLYSAVCAAAVAIHHYRKAS